MARVARHALFTTRLMALPMLRQGSILWRWAIRDKYLALGKSLVFEINNRVTSKREAELLDKNKKTYAPHMRSGQKPTRADLAGVPE